MTRREALGKFGMGLGAMALGHLLHQDGAAAAVKRPSALAAPHFAPKAKRVIYLFQSGGPSQLETFDYKPALVARNGEELPDSVRGGQRLTGMSANQASLPMAGSIFKFAQHGQSGAWVSELLPHTAKVVDDLCFIKSLHTEAINHDPAITFLQTGSQLSGRPSIGAWLSYGLGSENENLPAFVVLITKDQGGQPLYARLWGSGFLPAAHQGVRFRSGKDAVLYLDNPEGVSRESRRKLLDAVNELHHHKLQQHSDPALEARIAQYEMAFRMQQSIPEVTDLGDEPKHVLDLYGEDVHKPGSYAANCLLARRLAERGVRFIQLYHQGWDHHGNIPGGMKDMTQKTDQGSAALITDLKQRGMLEDTLVIWGGEFGRTNYSQGQLTATDYGRDHHPRCFTMWMAGGGVKPGMTWGATDELGYNIAENGVHVHDFHATLLHLLGIDHERLTYDFQGRAFRLTDVFGNVVNEVLA
ncbi:MAG: DUF1501 domain-containing protein [Candidatus Hydrogenedentes bacterium]|nr:DUF1501 domain-containing protein [Candidatus Hydrogenedentota bacterium]